ncbi:MAG: hypothetical protein HY512_03655 [Candidatus Aenigmarchaeota archaeon]|nr:hypothetical protein [Candidatus Aenigmarchaeota archaeon]
MMASDNVRVQLEELVKYHFIVFDPSRTRVRILGMFRPFDYHNGHVTIGNEEVDAGQFSHYDLKPGGEQIADTLRGALDAEVLNVPTVGKALEELVSANTHAIFVGGENNEQVAENLRLLREELPGRMPLVPMIYFEEEALNTAEKTVLIKPPHPTELDILKRDLTKIIGEREKALLVYRNPYDGQEFSGALRRAGYLVTTVTSNDPRLPEIRERFGYREIDLSQLQPHRLLGKEDPRRQLFRNEFKNGQNSLETLAKISELAYKPYFMNLTYVPQHARRAVRSTHEQRIVQNYVLFLNDIIRRERGEIHDNGPYVAQDYVQRFIRRDPTIIEDVKRMYPGTSNGEVITQTRRILESNHLQIMLDSSLGPNTYANFLRQIFDPETETLRSLDWVSDDFLVEWKKSTSGISEERTREMLGQGRLEGDRKGAHDSLIRMLKDYIKDVGTMGIYREEQDLGAHSQSNVYGVRTFIGDIAVLQTVLKFFPKDKFGEAEREAQVNNFFARELGKYRIGVGTIHRTIDLPVGSSDPAWRVAVMHFVGADTVYDRLNGTRRGEPYQITQEEKMRLIDEGNRQLALIQILGLVGESRGEISLDSPAEQESYFADRNRGIAWEQYERYSGRTVPTKDELVKTFVYFNSALTEDSRMSPVYYRGQNQRNAVVNGSETIDAVVGGSERVTQIDFAEPKKMTRFYDIVSSTENGLRVRVWDESMDYEAFKQGEDFEEWGKRRKAAVEYLHNNNYLGEEDVRVKTADILRMDAERERELLKREPHHYSEEQVRQLMDAARVARHEEYIGYEARNESRVKPEERAVAVNRQRLHHLWAKVAADEILYPLNRTPYLAPGSAEWNEVYRHRVALDGFKI